MTVVVLLWAALVSQGKQPADQAGRAGESPESRAVAYLAREVPRWSVQNRCFSCHNNGDAARALYTAARLSYPVPRQALTDTSLWLAQPYRWDRNRADPAFSDKRLARIQFAASLAAAIEAGLITDRRPLVQAAELVANDQGPDGSWQVDAQGTVGSPATYGACLASYSACRTLQKADPRAFGTAIARAQRWFRQIPVHNVLDAAAVLLALQDHADPEAAAQQERCLGLIRKGQSPEGGWGPFLNAPPEPFDTAIVLHAISRRVAQPQIKAMLQRGRAYLIAAQLPDGSWRETTRPPGSVSYAQHISTTGWATLALLNTRVVLGTR